MVVRDGSTGASGMLSKSRPLRKNMMRFSLRTLALATFLVVGVYLGLDAKPAQAQFVGSAYGYGSPYPGGYYNGYGGGGGGYMPYNSGYYNGGGPRSWGVGYGYRRFGMRRYWGPRYSPVPYSVGVPSI